MVRRIWLFVTLLLTLITVWPAAAQTTPSTAQAFTQQTDPASLIGAYYNAITLGDYQRAYNYWLSLPGNHTVAEFAAGFADTAKVQALVQLPIHEEVAVGGVQASVSTLLIATLRDGTQGYYSGCFTTNKVNADNAPNSNWYLLNAKLRVQPALDLTALAATCPQLSSLTDTEIHPSQSDPLQTIQSYFAALARGADSASYWENPQADPIMQSYSKEFTYMQSLSLFVNPEVKTQIVGDTIDALVPTLVVLNAPDNIHSYLTGCFTLRRSNTSTGESNWHLTNVALGGFSTDPALAINTVAEGCTP